MKVRGTDGKAIVGVEPVGGDSVDYESKWATLSFELR